MSDQYRVTGERAINGVDPGGTVTLDPDSVNIPALIAAGHVELVEVEKPASRKRGAKSEGVSDDGVQSDGRNDPDS